MPKRHKACELTFVVLELGMGLIGLGLLGQGTVAHVLHTQGGGNDQHLVQSTPLSRLQDHASHSGVQGQLGELFTQTRQVIELIHGTKFIEQLVAIGDGFGLRRL